MSENTALIIRCAKGYKSWGIFAARRYAEKHKSKFSKFSLINKTGRILYTTAI